MKRRNLVIILGAAALVQACALGPGSDETHRLIDRELQQTRPPATPSDSRDVLQALLPPLPSVAVAPTPPEHRFDLVVSGAPASQVFLAIVSGTPYSVLVPQEVAGSVSVNLKNVTLKEALDSLRELYGYEYRVHGQRITIQPLTLQTRVFQINYLTAQRLGRSDTRVTSGSIIDNTSTRSTAGATGTTGGLAAQGGTGTQVSTTSQNDFWGEIEGALKAVIGAQDGSQVVMSPQAGLIVVRAMPRQLREVEEFLKVSQVTVERQVMLEAKIVEVVLSEGFQSGVNWSAFTSAGDHRFSVGGNPSQFQLAAPSIGVTGAGGVVLPYNTDAGAFTPNTVGGVLASPLAGIQQRVPGSSLGNVMGLAFQTSSFSALLNFLETQGNVQVLSSPRIATLNNQKAVLKVGTDEFFVTEITTTTTSSGSSSSVSPSITVQPFFSGIALDVTPQIDERDNIILHIRPSVSVVSEKLKTINLGTLGVFQLPLASSSINETDSVVRVRDGNIVAIGGLMEQAQVDDNAKLPGLGDLPVGDVLFKQGRRALQKRELVVLIKPTVIHGDRQWADDLENTQNRLRAMRPAASPAEAAEKP